MTGRNSKQTPPSIRVGSTLAEIRDARVWVGERLRDAGCDAEFIGEALLAVGEALTNVVRHGYREVAGHPIEVSVMSDRSGVEIVIEDEAPFFKDSRGCGLPDPLDLAEGGYGLYLMQTVMDEVHREARGTSGNRLRLIKHGVGRARRAS